MLEQDIKKIEALAEERWTDNWNFREYLTNHVDPHLIDATAHRLNTEVSARIDCTTCGNCCRSIKPSLSGDEIKVLAKAKNMQPTAFLATYPAEEDEDGLLAFCRSPCPLLKELLCTVYQARPYDCASYPHLQQPDFLGGSIGTIENYRVCPIVFNVYEQMKRELNYDPSTDYIGDKSIEG